MPVNANSFGPNDGTYKVFIDELSEENCNNLPEVNRLVYNAFANGAMKVVVKRELSDLPRLSPKKSSGVVFISF